MTCETLHADLPPPDVDRSTPDATLGISEQLLVEVTNRLYSFFAKSGAVSDAEDLAQETLERLIRKFNHFDERRPLLPYLFAIARNVLRNYWRKNKHRNRLEVDWPDEVVLFQSTTSLSERTDFEEVDIEVALTWVQEHIGLSDFQCRAVALTAQGFTPKEIAEQLGVHARQVSRELNRAHDKVRSRLKRSDFIR
jgi:RNA polymerase sigma factor (sigma-70 family)